MRCFRSILRQRTTGEFSLLLGAEAGRVALGPNVLQPLGSVLVEAMDPVSQGLAIHAADAGGLYPVHPVQDRGEGQQASALVGVLRYGRKPAKLTGRKIRPHCHGCWHGADPPRTMEADQTQSGNPRESASKAAGIKPPRRRSAHTCRASPSEWISWISPAIRPASR